MNGCLPWHCQVWVPGAGGIGVCFSRSVVKKLPCRDVLVDWTLGPVNSAIYFSRPSSREDLTPSSSWGWTACARRGAAGGSVLPGDCPPATLQARACSAPASAFFSVSCNLSRSQKEQGHPCSSVAWDC